MPFRRLYNVPIIPQRQICIYCPLSEHPSPWCGWHTYNLAMKIILLIMYEIPRQAEIDKALHPIYNCRMIGLIPIWMEGTCPRADNISSCYLNTSNKAHCNYKYTTNQCMTAMVQQFADSLPSTGGQQNRTTNGGAVVTRMASGLDWLGRVLGCSHFGR